MFKNLILFSMIALVSCSTMTKNMTREGDLTLRGGVFRDKEWRDSITFKRKSWYLELTLAYDLMTAPVSKDSPFFNWFNPSEQAKINSCVDARVLLMYSWDTSRVTYQEVLMQIQKEGYTSFAIPSFDRQFKMHPNYTSYGLRPYGLWAICSQSKEKTIKVSIPGFKQETLKLQ